MMRLPIEWTPVQVGRDLEGLPGHVERRPNTVYILLLARAREAASRGPGVHDISGLSTYVVLFRVLPTFEGLSSYFPRTL